MEPKDKKDDKKWEPIFYMHDPVEHAKHPEKCVLTVLKKQFGWK